MSPGNAHPYSWASIINGVFDPLEINRVGYPAVADYLIANQDTLGIPGAKVTHVWAQENAIAQSIARSSGIHTISDSLQEMSEKVDAVILARDDPENHKAMAEIFIEAGIPIFIDKPLAYTYDDLNWFRRKVEEGKFIMSCSSMRYSNECRIIRQELATLGHIELVTAIGKKDWKKYGIHLLEAIYAVLDDPKTESVQHLGVPDKEIVIIRLNSGIDLTLHLYNHICGTFQVSVFGQKGWRNADIKNSYSMFRDNIIEFVRSVQVGAPRLAFEKTDNLIRTLIAARESHENGGIKIQLND